jgi:hypothetical protein
MVAVITSSILLVGAAWMALLGLPRAIIPLPSGCPSNSTYPRHETAVTIARAELTKSRWFSPMEPEIWGVFYSILVPDRGAKENICTEQKSLRPCETDRLSRISPVH